MFDSPFVPTVAVIVILMFTVWNFLVQTT